MTATAIQLHKTEALDTREQPATAIFTEEQEQLIRDSFMNGATKQEAQMLMEVAKVRRLSPFLRQIHFVKRWDKEKGAMVWSSQVGIDGFRTIADRTGKYDGQDEAEFGPLNQNGFPQWARVKVYRKDWARPSVGVAYWEEFVQTTKEGGVVRMWRTMPRVMLSKCAESIALRKAFPEDLSGLYTPEEMGQTENEAPRDVRPRERIAPHIDPDEEPDAPAVVGGPAKSIIERMLEHKKQAQAAADYDAILRVRAAHGAKGKASPLTMDIQKAKEARTVSPDEYKAMNKFWQHVERIITKVEKQLAPGPEASFVDDADEPEDELRGRD